MKILKKKLLKLREKICGNLNWDNFLKIFGKMGRIYDDFRNKLQKYIMEKFVKILDKF